MGGFTGTATVPPVPPTICKRRIHGENEVASSSKILTSTKRFWCLPVITGLHTEDPHVISHEHHAGDEHLRCQQLVALCTCHAVVHLVETIRLGERGMRGVDGNMPCAIQLKRKAITFVIAGTLVVSHFDFTGPLAYQPSGMDGALNVMMRSRHPMPFPA